MSAPLLQVENLRTWIDTDGAPVRAVDSLDIQIARGETFALVGESGCGKSMTALSIMRLLPEAGRIVSGTVRLDDLDLLALPEVEMRGVRGGRAAMIFQEPGLSLNPVLTVEQQLIEAVLRHTHLRGEAARQRCVGLLTQVGMPDPERRLEEYPFQLSGGMKQRVMIAIALAGDPDLLIADEPTTALDVTIQAQVLDVLRQLQQQTGMAMLLVTHDLGIVSQMAHTVAVMYAGEIVETAKREGFFRTPRHPYSRKLFASIPGEHSRREPLAVIRGTVPTLDRDFIGCRFADRCDHVWERCRAETPAWTRLGAQAGVRCHLYAENKDVPAEGRDAKRKAAAKPATKTRGVKSGTPLLEVRDLKVHFPIRRGLFKRAVNQVKAVDGVSLEMSAGQTLALVGESGSGKTTIGKAVLQLISPTDGSVRFDQVELTELSRRQLRPLRRALQIVFQDPYASLDPRMRIADVIEEGMAALGVGNTPAERARRVDELLEQVGLPAATRTRYPHEFSGGQRQRIAIARALAVEPRLIVCDEPTSALDVSVQAQMLNLLRDLQERLGVAYLFITHNMGVVGYLAHDVAVLYLGRIVERGRVEEVLKQPRHPYTQALLSAVPTLDAKTRREIIRLEGDLPSPSHPPVGCHFHPRCPQAMDVCRREYPATERFSDTHEARCHLFTTGIDSKRKKKT